MSFVKFLGIHKTLLLSVFILFTLEIQAQIRPIVSNKLIEVLHSRSDKIISDQIYLQTSKGIYETGEDLWFKAYVLDSRFLEPSDKSRTLYLQMSDENGVNHVWQEKYEIKNGFAEGHVYINDTLALGTYFLTAFTQNSIFNNDLDYHSARKIRVVDRIENNEQDQNQKKVSLGTFSLFPEGGHLVSGLDNRLAFKAVDTDGNPIKAAGTLFENGNPLLEFISEHDGMGSFDFRPQHGKDYYIKLKELNQDSSYQLPKILSQGISLRMKGQQQGHLVVKINGNLPYKGTKVFLRLQQRGVGYGLAEGVLKDSLIVRFPLKDVNQGIAEVTLFDEDLRPLAERLAYVNLDKGLHIKTELSNTGEYSLREKAVLNIRVTDDKGNPVRAHLGVSVYDQAYQNLEDAKNIVTHYNLSTQLVGTIHDPTYYFNEDNMNRQQALDLLLMTQGWRRYVWDEKNMPKQPSQRFHFLSDTVSAKMVFQKKPKKEPIGQKIALGYTPLNEDDKEFILADSLDTFTIGPRQLKQAQGNYYYMKPMNELDKGNKLLINIDRPFHELNQVRPYEKIVYPGFNSITNEINQDIHVFRTPKNTIRLQEVTVEGKTIKIIRDKYLGKLDSIANLGIRDYVAPCGHLNCPVRGYEPGYPRPVEGKKYQRIQGFKWTDESNGIYSIQGYETIIYRYPKHTETEILEKFNLTRIKGYYGHREFYQPKYDVEENLFPDYRNTLLWAPSVFTNNQGEAKLEFYCSDINTLFIGNIEGVDANGLLGRHRFEFLVRR